jgi:hypothetical protein
MWMSRLAGTLAPPGRIPESTSYVNDWEALKRERAACDERIIAWAEDLDRRRSQEGSPGGPPPPSAKPS